MSFRLQYDTALQGVFEPKDRNVAYIFQVNCPGCFIYGFPLINTWFEKYKSEVGFVGVSTCFEDFDLNTVENTEKLLLSGTMVGETQSYFSRHEIFIYPDIPKFPIVFDQTIEPSLYFTSENLKAMCKDIPGYERCSIEEKKEVSRRLKHYYYNLPKIAMTFQSNQLKGTPSYVMFDRNFEITHAHFGNLPSSDIEFYF